MFKPRSKALKTIVIAAIGVIAIASLSGCSRKSTPSADSSSNEQVSGSNQDAPTIDFSGLSDSELVSLAIDQLNSECSNLTDYAADANSWQLDSRTDSEAELRLYGDGGTIGIQAISDDIGGVYLLISQDFADSSNPLLWNSGCKVIAHDPEQDVTGGTDAGAAGTDGTDAGSGGGTDYVPQVQSYQMPNLVGYSEDDARSWFISNGLSTSVLVRYQAFNPNLDCEVNGWGPVVSTTPGYGGTFDDSPTSRVTLTVDCER